MSLVWGVSAYLHTNQISTDATFKDIENRLKVDNHVNVGDIIINTASMPLKVKGKTNRLKIYLVE
jgi:pyruvate kinase